MEILWLRRRRQLRSCWWVFRGSGISIGWQKGNWCRIRRETCRWQRLWPPSPVVWHRQMSERGWSLSWVPDSSRTGIPRRLWSTPSWTPWEEAACWCPTPSVFCSACLRLAKESFLQGDKLGFYPVSCLWSVCTKHSDYSSILHPFSCPIPFWYRLPLSRGQM